MNATTGEMHKSLNHGDILRCATIGADSKFVVGGTVAGDLILWDLSTGRQAYTLHCHRSELLSVAINPSGRQIATGGKDGLIRLWDLQSLRESWQFDVKK